MASRKKMPAPPPKKSVATRQPRGASRQMILDWLTNRGGEIVDTAGRATTIMHAESGYPGSMGGLAAILQAMEKEGAIVRSVSGRRCSRIALAQMPTVEPEAENTPTSRGVGMVLLGSRPVVEPILPPVEVDPRYDELAWSLLRACTDVLSSTGQPAKDIQQQLAVAEGRLEQTKHELTRTRYELSEQIGDLRDELKAVKYENRGLRDRVRRAEENNNVLTGQLQRRQPRGTDGFKALDRMMREVPAARG